MIKNKIAKKAFTLIELLVVITIIWILATGGIAVYTEQIKKSRDTVRIQDIQAVQWAIEQSYQDSGDYPGITGGAFTWAVSKYLNNNLVQDKKTWQSCASWAQCDYIYAVSADITWIDNWAYELSTAFESQWNLDSKAKKSSDNWDDDTRYELGTWYNNCGWTSAPCNSGNINTKMKKWGWWGSCTNCLILKK